MIRAAALAAALGAAGSVLAAEPPPGVEIVILGEIHDNPAHHATQAEIVGRLAPRAVVWEMLDPAQAGAAGGFDPADARALEAALGWNGSGWPDFAMYHPIFVAAGGAAHFGAAVDRDTLSRAVAEGAAAVFGPEAAAYGLTPLATEDQAAREAEQQAAHCNALPVEMLPGMVEAQRLRDAAFARTALEALDRHGPPVVVITGTGHARRDTGIPAALAAARPGLRVWSLGQTELAEGAEPEADAPFDALITTPPVPREDPCLAFRHAP
jgi:uncharacterized iron-regulated protein